MNIITKAALALVAGVFLFGAGWLSHKPDTKVVTQVQKQVVTQEHVVTKVVTKTEKATNGTTTTTTTTETASDKKKESAKHDSQPVASAGTPYLPRWSVGVNWTPRLEPDVYVPTNVELAHRLWDTNAWITTGYDWRVHAAAIGLRIDF